MSHGSRLECPSFKLDAPGSIPASRSRGHLQPAHHVWAESNLPRLLLPRAIAGATRRIHVLRHGNPQLDTRHSPPEATSTSQLRGVRFAEDIRSPSRGKSRSRWRRARLAPDKAHGNVQTLWRQVRIGDTIENEFRQMRPHFFREEARSRQRWPENCAFRVIETSYAHTSGTRRPASARARHAPCAMASLPAKIALTGSPRAIIDLAQR